MNNQKFILDACCGPKLCWLQKQQENTIYMDIRQGNYGGYEIKPDIIGDFTNLPLQIKDKKFKLILWDPPHIKDSVYTIYTDIYGYLGENWRETLRKGFENLFDLLEVGGILIFKFNNINIEFLDVLPLFKEKPLFFNMTKDSTTQTRFYLFMKLK